MALPARTTDFIFNTGSALITSVDVTLDVTADYGGTTYFTSTMVVEKSGVALTVDVDYTVSTVGSDYRITFTTAVNPSMTPIRIYRRTDRSQTLVQFPGATTSLDAQRHLNKANWQWLFIVQELYDMILTCIRAATSTRGVTWDFLDYIGANCKDPVLAQDVSTKHYTDVQDEYYYALAKAYTDAAINALRIELHAYIANAIAVAIAALRAELMAYINTLMNTTFIPGTTSITRETVTMAAGATVVTTTGVVNVGPSVVMVDGVTQELGEAYTITGAKELTFSEPFSSTVRVHVIHYTITP